MAKKMERKLDENNVEATFDLDEIFGRRVPNRPALRQAIGQEILDVIERRTAEGKSRFGRNFRKYSKEYTQSLDFKAFGKSQGDINLRLTGQMMGTMDIVRDDRSSVTIGWNDPKENPKAYNHITGDTVKKRDFFGLNGTELRELKAEFKDAFEEDTPAISELLEIIRG